MKKYAGGAKVTQGTYMNMATGQFLQLYGQDVILPEAASVKFVKVPVGLVLIAGPLMGLAYIIFLPLTGIASPFVWAGYRVRTWTMALAHRG